ncbi:hypothetical protein CP966_20235 [Streptomyces galilaeus]|uniref:hypothetical protein n=1 Tax=Streptomyces galilaeus TaxID=33899 RepID=UPI00123D56F4|nr:hypothetical protein [Streptomyces galilaeus]QEU67307.1 hypothetical protein CP966_20235 [Streptomyces galilaeus]GGW45046.1 hypothetical protein GCM10010350_31190 [Streptomyces galilaeus]
MSSTNSNPQVPGVAPGSGSTGGNGDDDKKIRKYETIIILLASFVAGIVAGGLRLKMEHVSYYEAGTTIVLVTGGLAGFIILIVRFIRNQS